ncbi:hypothetical protein GCM10027446_13140 [Angustibacter peucedani]
MDQQDPYRHEEPKAGWAQPYRPAPQKRPLTAWHVAGIVTAVVVGVCGLALLGAAILFMVALNSWGDNK